MNQMKKEFSVYYYSRKYPHTFTSASKQITCIIDIQYVYYNEPEIIFVCESFQIFFKVRKF